MMTLTKKRIDTLETLRQRFPGQDTITRAQVQTALAENLITAWPYWLTDDLSLKVGRGEWKLLNENEFTMLEPGGAVTSIMTRRAFVQAGLDVPDFRKPRAVKPVGAPRGRPRKTPIVSAEAEIVQMPVPRKSKSLRKPHNTTQLPSESDIAASLSVM